MLALTRHEDQFIRIGKDIIIKHCGKGTCGGIVIGIEAPRDIPIVRGELIGTAKEHAGRKLRKGGRR